MRKLKLNLSDSDTESLSKEQLKTIFGGLSSGGCSMVFSYQGYSSCWYTTDPSSLCHRVYGDNCGGTMPVDCGSDCTMN